MKTIHILILLNVIFFSISCQRKIEQVVIKEKEIIRLVDTVYIDNKPENQGSILNEIDLEESFEEQPYAFNFSKEPSMSEVLNKAKKLKRLVYMDVGASWCIPCQLMKRDVYTNNATAQYFNQNFVNYVVDGEKKEGPDLKIIYNITTYPTLLILDHKGREISRNEGALYHESLTEWAKAAETTYENMEK